MTAMMAFWVAVVSLVFGAVCSTLHLSLRGLSRSRIDQLAERDVLLDDPPSDRGAHRQQRRAGAVVAHPIDLARVKAQ